MIIRYGKEETKMKCCYMDKECDKNCIAYDKLNKYNICDRLNHNIIIELELNEIANNIKNLRD